MTRRCRPYVACAVLQVALVSCEAGGGQEPHLTGEFVYTVEGEVRALDLATRSIRVIYDHSQSVMEMAPLDRGAFVIADWDGIVVIREGKVAANLGPGRNPSYFSERGVLFYYVNPRKDRKGSSLFRAELRDDKLENATEIEPRPSASLLPVVQISETEGVYEKAVRVGSEFQSRLIKYNLATGEKSVIWTDPSGRASPKVWRSATGELLVSVGESVVALREGSTEPREIRGLKGFIISAYLEDSDALLGCRERHTTFPGPGIGYDLVLYDFATGREWELGVRAGANTRDAFVR